MAEEIDWTRAAQALARLAMPQPRFELGNPENLITRPPEGGPYRVGQAQGTLTLPLPGGASANVGGSFGAHKDQRGVRGGLTFPIRQD